MGVDLELALLLLVDLGASLMAGGLTLDVFRRSRQVRDRLGALLGLVVVAAAVLVTTGLVRRSVFDGVIAASQVVGY